MFRKPKKYNSIGVFKNLKEYNERFVYDPAIYDKKHKASLIDCASNSRIISRNLSISNNHSFAGVNTNVFVSQGSPNTRINNLQDEYIAADGVLSQKIDNVIDQNRSLIGSLSMPSQKYVDLTLGASGTKYTAPANGYVCISMKGNTNSYYLNIDTHDVYGYNQAGTIVGYSLTQTIPVAKGQSFEILYYNMSLNFFRFVYTEGDK